MDRQQRLPVLRTSYKTAVFTFIVIATNVLGNFLLDVGMKRVGTLVLSSPLSYIAALANPYVAMGVILLIAWMLSHMALLSWADLSYVLPVTSLGYVMAALTGHFLLNESVSASHWTGIAFIVSGVFLVGRTNPRTPAE